MDFVNANGYLHIKEPDQNQKQMLNNAIINRNNIYKSQHDIVEEIMDKMSIEKSYRNKLHNIIKTGYKDELDSDRLYEKIGEFFCRRMLKPICSKQDTMLLLLETLKLINDTEEILNEKGKVIIYVDKMSRVFYETDDKIFSFYFPFALDEKEPEYYRIYDILTDLEITNKMISLLISIFKNDRKLGESF